MLSFKIDAFVAGMFATKTEPTSKTLAIVCFGLIGDYILFRNMLQGFKESKRYKDYKITLIANMCCKSLALGLDYDFVDEFIWIDHKKLSKNILYRYKTFMELSKRVFTEVIVPSESRSILHTDLLALALQAKSKLSMISCNRNIGDDTWKQEQKAIANAWYTKLFEIDYTQSVFEFDINRQVFEKITGEELRFKKPEIIIPSSVKLPEKIVLPEKYIIFAVGGSIKGKRWPAIYFSKLAKYIIEKSDYQIVFCGDKNDALEGDEVCKNLTEEENKRILNLCGKTSLMELLLVIRDSKILIGGESSAIHMAVALEADNGDNEIFVIFPNRSFTRFAPYPEYATKKYHLVNHDKIERNDDGSIKCKVFENSELLEIADILPEKLIENVSKYF